MLAIKDFIGAKQMKLSRCILIWGLFSVAVSATAQTTNDKGNLTYRGQIAATTCLLQATDNNGNSSLGGVTQIFGNINNTTASAVPVGSPIAIISTNFALKDASGTANCDLGVGGKWDISMLIDTNTYTVTNGDYFGNDVVFPQSQTLNQNIVILFNTQITGLAGTNIKLFPSKVSPAYGILMSGSTTLPAMSNTDTIKLNTQLFRKLNTAVLPGTFSMTIPLMLVYK